MICNTVFVNGFGLIKILFTATKILLGPVRSNKGNFIGYSMDGMPMYSFTRDALQQTSQSLVMHLKHSLKQVLEDNDSRKIFYFLCINLVR
jgi:zinc transporter 5/7